MSTVINTYEIVSNYCTDALQKVLTMYSEKGFTLVSALMAQNRYGVEVMYLFFTKTINED